MVPASGLERLTMPANQFRRKNRGQVARALRSEYINQRSPEKEVNNVFQEVI